jgi:hypothetical protein
MEDVFNVVDLRRLLSLLDARSSAQTPQVIDLGEERKKRGRSALGRTLQHPRSEPAMGGEAAGFNRVARGEHPPTPLCARQGAGNLMSLPRLSAPTFTLRESMQVDALIEVLTRDVTVS